ISFRNLSGSASRIATFKKTRIVVIHILEKALKSEDTFAVTSLSGSLAAVLATPALFLASGAQAQSGGQGVTQLSPVQVQGDTLVPYDVKDSASTKFTAPLLDTPKS
ncbi:hypothetical protein LZC38_08590, partial [Campylobacter jejuni]